MRSDLFPMHDARVSTFSLIENSESNSIWPQRFSRCYSSTDSFNFLIKSNRLAFPLVGFNDFP